MLKDEDRIFKNLYNDLGWDVDSSIKRGDWLNTKDILSKSKDSIIQIQSGYPYDEEKDVDVQIDQMKSNF